MELNQERKRWTREITLTLTWEKVFAHQLTKAGKDKDMKDDS